jgi:hypothetical protein
MSIILCFKIHKFSAKYERKTPSCPITSPCPITKPKVYIWMTWKKIKSCVKEFTQVTENCKSIIGLAIYNNGYFLGLVIGQALVIGQLDVFLSHFTLES